MEFDGLGVFCFVENISFGLCLGEGEGGWGLGIWDWFSFYGFYEWIGIWIDLDLVRYGFLGTVLGYYEGYCWRLI